MRILLFFTLVGCSDPWWHVRLPDHSEGIVTECSAYQGECIKHASAACPEGYDVVEQPPGHVMNTSEHHTFAFRCSTPSALVDRGGTPPADANTSVGCGPGYAAQKNDAGANVCVHAPD